MAQLRDDGRQDCKCSGCRITRIRMMRWTRPAPVPPGYLTARTLGPYAAGSAVPRMEISVKARKRAQSWRKPTSGSTQTRLPTLAHLATLSLLVDD